MDRLGFDLISGLMTVDYQAHATDPEAIRRLIVERTGMQASLVGQTAPAASSSASWWSRHGRWASTIASGLALALGLGAGWLGPHTGLGETGGAERCPGMFRPGRISRRGLALSPGPAQRAPLPPRHRCADGPGHRRGGRALSVGRGGHRRVPLRPVGVAGIDEPGTGSSRDSPAPRDRTPDGRTHRRRRRHRANSRRIGPDRRPHPGPVGRHRAG